jgi:hypothetical protein
MKRLKILLVFLLSFTLTGCIKEYSYTDEKSNAIAEYMASLLLKYDKDYDQALIPDDELNESSQDDAGSTVEDTTSDTEDTSGTSGAEVTQTPSDTNNDYSLIEVLGIDGFDMAYSGYKLADTYPEDADSAGFTLTPRNGYQLLVTEFTVKNISDQKKELNLINSDISYQLDINMSTVYKPLLTLLQNDLQYIDMTIAGGKSEKVLLVFEISKDVDMSNVNLIVSKDGISNTFEIK